MKLEKQKHILLVTKSIENYNKINLYFQKSELLNSQYILSWLSDYYEWKTAKIDRPYRIYLVEEEFFWLLRENNQIPDLPLITLVRDYDIGLHTIQAGATDYWQITNLNHYEIERSLRLLEHSSDRFTSPYNQTNQTFYEEFLKHCVDGLFTIDILSDGTLIYSSVNSAYEKLTGIPQEKLIGKKITEVLLKLEERKYLDCLFSQKTVNYERIVQIKGQNQTCLIVLVPIKNQQGQVSKIQGIAKNITQEKQALTSEIRRTRYRNLLRSIVLEIRQSLDISKIIKTTVTELHKSLNTERVVIIEFKPDGSGKIIEESVTPQFPEMLGKVISKEHHNHITSYNYDKGFFDNWEDIETANISDYYREFLQQYQIRASLVVPIIRRFVIRGGVATNPNRDGSNIYANSIARLWGLLCIHQCSEPRKWTKDEVELLQQLVEQLNIALSQAELLESEVKQRQELARSNAELEQFAYVASHDLQAPLQTISNYAQLLEHRYHQQLDDKADKYINYIVSAVERMRTQINDLLDYSRVDRQQNTFRETDLRIAVEQAIANLQSEIELNQAQIFYSDRLPKLIVDPSQFVTLFQNLISNSLKYRRSIPLKIKISVTQRDRNWQFLIRDNGIGIEEKHQKRIFQIFQRLHTQEEYPGNGIGLAICQKIVQRHGGNIGVKSQINRGTTFYFTIPKQK